MTTFTKTINTLPEISTLIKQMHIKAKKSLGQNFLIDDEINDKIVRIAAIQPNDIILEIGPGVGSLTRHILRNQPHKLVAVEKDIQFQDILMQLADIAPNMEVLLQDALFFQEEDLYTQYNTKFKIIANLPYNVGTKLILKWFHKKQYIDSMVLMLQKEVTERLVAQPCTKAYGSLSIIAQLLFSIEPIFDIQPESFSPPPKIISTVIRMIPHPTTKYNCNMASLEKIIKASFAQRRKMVKKNLATILPNIEQLLQELGVNTYVRAEELTIEQFCLLSLKI